MILSEFEIQQRRDAYDKELRSRKEVLTIADTNYVGHSVHYFFKYPIGDGSYGICGVIGRILKLHEPQTEDKELFGVDLAIASHIPGFFVEELGLMVTSVVMEDGKGVKTSGICRFEDIDIVEKVMNEKFQRGTKRPSLQLVVNNPDKQEQQD